jgi:hypothetical protein
VVAELGAVIYDAELGAKIYGAEVTALVLCYHVAFGACGGNTHVVACTRP